MPRSALARLALAGLLLALAGLVTVTVLAYVNAPEPPRPPAAPTAPPAEVKVDPSPDGDLEVEPGDEVEDLSDPTPEGVSRERLREADEVHERKERLQDPRPPAGAQTLDCPRHFVRGVGSRQGHRALGFKVHFTVSGNRPGRGDLVAIRNFFRTVQADSTFGIDFEGNCEQWKSTALAPYTQKSFNKTSEAVEIIATGRESRAEWLRSPLIRDGLLAELIRDRLRAMGSPLRFVDPVGCIDKRGWTDHNHLECGNDHTDVAPNFPFDVVKRQVLMGADPVPHKVSEWCRKVEWYRGLPKARQTPARRRLANERKAIARKRGYDCASGGPVKRA